MVVASKQIKSYFSDINKNVNKCYDIARAARAKNLDPMPDVEIMLAHNMAERVIGLISTVAPQLLNTKLPDRIQELEKEYGTLDWRVGFKVAEETAKEKFCKFKDKKEAMEIGIRTGFAYLTLGIVAAPLEGFIGIDIKKRKDGKEYFALKYAGPIRGAGGTAASTSVILSDYVRVKMGYATYDPEEIEVNRYTTELNDYHERVTNLQYRPSDEEVKFMVSHLPVEVDGDPTEKIEVSNYKDLPRINTNLIRGGVALVLAEGLCQKAPKLWKRLSKWGQDFDLEWTFISDFLKLKEKIHAAHNKESTKDKKGEDEKSEEKTVKANDTFIADLVAGRPVLTHPLAEGGFRLRYGRGRTSGFSATAAHPATLIVLDKYIAIGTQLKIERPGKAATITLCDTLEGPIVKLVDGSVVKLNSEEQAKKVVKDVIEVTFLGDILFNYGDFSENGQRLVPPGYCPEWWTLELNEAIKKKYNNKEVNEKEVEILCSELEINKDEFNKFFKEPLFNIPSFENAVNLSKELNIPLHPEYTYFWKLLSYSKLVNLQKYLRLAKLKKDDKGIRKIILPYSITEQKDTFFQNAKRSLELLGVPHQVINKESIVLDRIESKIFALVLNFKNQNELENIFIEETKTVTYKNALDYFNKIFLKNNIKIQLQDKAGTFIGARMGRPEKAKMRMMKGKPHVLFPVGDEGDRLRSFQAAMSAKKVTADFPLHYCEDCKKDTVYRICEICGKETSNKFFCRICGLLEKDTCRHGKTMIHKRQEIDINYYFNEAKKHIKEKIHPDLIKGIKGTSNKEHVVEHLAKGILRAKHNVYVNKDGTTRYDCTELPLTHFKSKEVRTSVEKLRKLGYKKDIYGNELTDSNQILELKPQDLVLPGLNLLEKSSAIVLKNVADYVDELLVKFYGLKAYYKIKKEEDLVGHYVIGLAPHISAGSVGRIIGFSETQGLLAHPIYHAGMRRDCDGDEAAILLLLDGLLNFSKKYLPSSRGSTMDAPLVLTANLKPAEVDDQVLGMDVEWSYPLEFYQAAVEMKNPWEVRYGDDKKIEQLDHRLDTELQYENMGFTHHVDNFNKGVCCSAYKILPTMKEKLFGQMEIAKKVRAVDMDDVARMVIQKHFLSDIKGNLRKYSMQKFRCAKCNTKYRRPPLSAKCDNCHSKLIFTISEGSIVKYLEPSLELADNYDFSPYLKQTINMLKMNIDVIFGKDKDKQVGLGNFMS
jgi:DNA polymerase II large subunit